MALPCRDVVFITPDGFCADTAAAVSLARDALAGGVSIVQIRDRVASFERMYAVVAAFTSELGGAARFVVNGSHAVSIAKSIPGIGVHVREERIGKDMEAALSLIHI